jgi:hypothetical protein
VKSNGAVSPIILPIAMITPVSILEEDAGITILKVVSALLAPKASDASLYDFGTATRLS